VRTGRSASSNSRIFPKWRCLLLIIGVIIGLVGRMAFLRPIVQSASLGEQPDQRAPIANRRAVHPPPHSTAGRRYRMKCLMWSRLDTLIVGGSVVVPLAHTDTLCPRTWQIGFGRNLRSRSGAVPLSWSSGVARCNKSVSRATPPRHRSHLGGLLLDF